MSGLPSQRSRPASKHCLFLHQTVRKEAIFLHNVAKRRADGVYEQWVCVRPCFGPEGKQTSHWACIEQLPEKNIKKKGENWYVPTGLGVNKEHMRNLAEMINAILYPNQWAANLQNDPNLTVFHDFEHKNLMYHTAAYWQQVCKNWDKLSIFAALFNYNSNEDAKNALRKAIAEDGPSGCALFL